MPNNEWRDISTAPKDGTMILIYPIFNGGRRRGGKPFASAAYWHQPGNPASKGFWVPGWALTQYPTHWMPMITPEDKSGHGTGKSDAGLLEALSSAEQRFRTIGMGTCEWEHMTRENMRATCDIAMMGESACRAAIAAHEVQNG